MIWLIVELRKLSEGRKLLVPAQAKTCSRVYR